MVCILFATGATLTAAQPKSLHVYHVGNSLTQNIIMDRLYELMRVRDIDYQFGSQKMAGTTLKQAWEIETLGRKFGNRETNIRKGDRYIPGSPDGFNPPKRFGNYVVGTLTHFCVLSGQSPVGLNRNALFCSTMFGLLAFFPRPRRSER